MDCRRGPWAGRSTSPPCAPPWTGRYPRDPATLKRVIEALAGSAEAGLIASAGPRYFGFVVGGSVPASLAADWLTSAWDQNAGLYALSPAAAVVEEVVARWLVELFGLPEGASVGFTTGATMASFTALAAGRHRVLQRTGWNVEDDGYVGAPAIEVVVGDESHVTIFASLQMLGLGRKRVHRVAADEQGRMRADALRETLARIDGPILVCAQAGNVNTGSFDPLPEIVEAVRAKSNAWLADMIDHCCAIARRMAGRLEGATGVVILNDVVLNQVLVRFSPPSGDDGAAPDPAAIDDFTRRVVAAVQADGTCWAGATTWHGMAAMRISVSNWSTTEADADLSVEAMLRCARDAAATREGV